MNLAASDDTRKLFLHDLGSLLKDAARDAIESRDGTQPGTDKHVFESGRVVAFNEVISTIQQQAGAFGILLEELQLHDIRPDEDLV